MSLRFAHHLYEPRPESPATREFLRWTRREGADREAEYWEQLELSGQVVSPEAFAARDKAAAQTRLMSDRIADRMDRLRIGSGAGRRGGGYHDGEAIRIVAPLSGGVEQVPPYRRCNAIPYIAQQKRANTLKELIHYVETADVRQFRHWVIHDGPRCHSLHLSDRWKEQNRKVRNWNKSDFAKRYGVTVVFRSNEAGSPLRKNRFKTRDNQGRKVRDYERRADGTRIRCVDQAGRQTWHPHTHLVVEFARGLSDDEFRAVILRAQEFFGTPHLDAGKLREPREACKYVVKCDELHETRDNDFRRFLRRTRGKHLVQALGGLRDQIRDHRERCIRLRHRFDEETGRSYYQPTKNHNASVYTAQASQSDTLRAGLNAMQSGPLHQCAIVARLTPQAHFCPVSEPLFMVRGRVDVAEFESRPQVAPVVENCREYWENGAAMFEALHGVSIESFLQAGAPVWARAAAPAERPDPGDLLGSAHNTPVNGRPAPPDPNEADDPVVKRASEWGEVERSEPPNSYRNSPTASETNEARITGGETGL